ncbi:MAG TPA: SEC-C metal-binding domain-containing protein, partial [Gemmatimonadaceae bacterium]|nr:SEC-C metal-binding domain-containing protein [Gemmatimonadaceae bacterium]
TTAKPSKVKDAEGKIVDVMEDGGLHIIGSERHESRRIDRQLRGRAGRQGDPGASQFFLSLEDDLMRLFGSDRIAKLMDAMGAKEGEVLTHSLITRSIEQAQKRVELQNFQSRKRLLEYDDVMNQQREVVYSLRSFALEGGEELRGEAERMIEKAVGKRVETALAETEEDGAFDIELLRQELMQNYMLIVPEFEKAGEWPTTIASARQAAVTAAIAAFEAKMRGLNEFAGRLLSLVMLNVLDEKWKDHLYDLDQLRNAIHYRSWGQQDPLVEYKQEAYTMFVDLMQDMQHTFTERFARAQIVFEGQQGGDGGQPAAPPAPPRPTRHYNALGILEDVEDVARTATGTDEDMDIGPAETPTQEVATTRADPAVVGLGRQKSLTPQAPAGVPGVSGGAPAGADWTNVKRNDPCPCGSGKKFKKCHGAVMA